MTRERTLLAVLGAIIVVLLVALSAALYALARDPIKLEDAFRRAAFEWVYAERQWGSDKAGKGTSGPGSTLEFTRLYRVFLQDFFAEHGIRSVVDAGCGDWQFSQAIDWTGIDYLGVDIVPSLIEANKQRFGKPNIRFAVADIVRDELPAADLLVVKDVLQHLSYADIDRFARQFSRYRHVLLVNGVDPVSLTAEPKDIGSGRGARGLDPTRPPLSMQGTKVLVWRHEKSAKLVVHLTPQR